MLGRSGIIRREQRINFFGDRSFGHCCRRLQRDVVASSRGKQFPGVSFVPRRVARNFTFDDWKHPVFSRMFPDCRENDQLNMSVVMDVYQASDSSYVAFLKAASSPVLDTKVSTASILSAPAL